MSKFKVGDRVRRINSDHAIGMRVGQIGIVDGFVSGNPHVEGEDKGLAHSPDNLELVASQGPVVTETVKRIVPGVYGTVVVGGRDNEFLPLAVSFNQRHFTAPELRAAAAVLLELAGALE